MSMSRLCVRSSKCSMDSLSMCGERITKNRLRPVGNGTGPATRAPVRRTVSTMRSADWSSTLWSNALSLMRMRCAIELLHHLGDGAGAHRPPAFPDRKPQPLFQRHRRDQRHLHRDVVPRYHHLHPVRQLNIARHVRRPKVELRPVPREERRVPPSLFLGQHVHLRLELRVRPDTPRLRQHHPPLDLFLLDPAQQHAHVVPRHRLVQRLAEHLDPRHHRPLRLRPQPHDLHLFPYLHLPALHPPRRHRPPPRDREDVLHRHQKRLFPFPPRPRNVRVHRVHPRPDLFHPLVLPPPHPPSPPPPPPFPRPLPTPPPHPQLFPPLLVLAPPNP